MRRFTVAAMCAAGFLMVSVGVGNKSGVSALDEAVWRFFSDRGNATVSEIARSITSLGVVSVLLPGAFLAGIVIWFVTRSLVFAAAPWLTVQVSSVLVRETKGHYRVPRPPIAEQAVKTLNPAFPSGHVANTAAFAVVVAAVLCASIPSTRARATVWGIAVVAVATMAWTRLALNVHWFSDVLGGALLGSTVGFAVAGVALWVNELRLARLAVPVDVRSDLDA